MVVSPRSASKKQKKRTKKKNPIYSSKKDLPAAANHDQFQEVGETEKMCHMLPGQKHDSQLQ